jgi:hypothetical protein
MTDQLGLWEHALYTTPRTEHGFCTDDNARALIVACRQPDPSLDLVNLAGIYLTFLQHAQLAGGGFHNRRNFDGSWADEVGSDDSQGRALWALGEVARHGQSSWMRESGLDIIDKQRDFDSPFLRANAFAVLGSTEALYVSPDHHSARHILERCIGHLSVRDDDRWPWPEDRLAYDNARIPEALMAAGALLATDGLIDAGLRLLEWLVEKETLDGHFSFTPVDGWAPGEPRPGFDQQPVEAAAMGDACFRAWSLTGDTNRGMRRWAQPRPHQHESGSRIDAGRARSASTRRQARPNRGAPGNKIQGLTVSTAYALISRSNSRDTTLVIGSMPSPI